jgi:hypothetical protein
VVAARATAEELVAGRLWQVDGADLLAAAYAFHAGLPRQAATAAHVQAMQQPNPGPRSRPDLARSAVDGRSGRLDGAARFPSELRRAALDPHRLPGPRLGQLDRADVAKLWRWCRTCPAVSSPHEASSSD